MPQTPVIRENPPVCELCANTRLQKYGVKKGRQAYYCPPCNRVQRGYPIPEPKPTPKLLPCPKCRGRSRIVRTHGRRHQLICTVCRHNFTDIYVNSPSPRRSEGPFPHRKTFAFDPVSFAALGELCAAKGLSGVQALRYLLHRQAERPIATITTSRAVRAPDTGEVEIVTKRTSIPAAPINRAKNPDPRNPIPSVYAPLPNAFPEASREMSRRHKEQGRTFEQGNPPTVGLVGRITLCMDDKAKHGLLLTMQRYQTDHQNALRQLLRDTKHEGRW